MTDELKYAAQECNDIRGLPPRWFDFDTLAITYGIGHTDAMFIVAASPDAVLALKAENERLREALRAALEQPEKEPVAWNKGVLPMYPTQKDGETFSVSYYADPPQRKPLTNDEIALLYMSHTDQPRKAYWEFARAIEQAHGIGEKP